MNFLYLFAAVMVTLFSASAQPQTASTTKSLATTIGESFIAGVNSASTQERIEIVRRIYAATALQELGEERLVGLFGRINNDYGTLIHHHSEIVGNYLHLYAQLVIDSTWRDFQFQVEPTAPRRLQHIVFIAEVTEPVYLPNGNIDDQFTLNWLNEYIDKLVQENDLSASVLLARGDLIFFERYVGYADAQRTQRVDSSTLFNLGSGNKMFTAIAIIQLQNAGKLSVSDTLVKYFPDFPNKTFIETATIHHLLSHTSGLGDFFGEGYDRAKGSIAQLVQMLPCVYDDSIAFQPGSAFQYSNSGFILAGLIVEKTSDRNYFDYVKETIYKPLGMQSTDSYMRNDTTVHLAEPLSKSEKGWIVAHQGKRGSSAGGGYSTARDMLKFACGLKNNTILKQSDLDIMTESKNKGLEDSYPYGYGFTLSIKRNRLISYGHGGMAAGVNFEFQYYPDEDITMIVFCNQDNGAYDDLRKNIVKLITGDR